MKTIKILCVCAWGNVRSVAMAQHIKNLNGKYKNHRQNGTLKYEAIAIGNSVTSPETRKMLNEWADYVIDMRNYLPNDIWGNPRDEDLQKEVAKIWEKLSKENHLLE